MKYRFFPVFLFGALFFTPPEYQPFRFPSFDFDPFAGAPKRPSPALRAHSHNDFAQERPLIDALESRFYSVEADVWLHAGELVVSHLGFNLTGRLEDLYLEPLQRRVNRYGTVHGDGQGFLLWLDIKDRSPELTRKLHEMLARYPMLTRFTDDGITPGPVTIVMTGSREAKKRYARYSYRFACHDQLRFSASDPGAGGKGGDPWCWYALNWATYFKWDGSGAMPEFEARMLRSLVKGVREKGRRLRFWNVPDTPEAWAATLDAGVDLVATDSPRTLAGFLAARGMAPAIRGLASPAETP
jgi:hypothetical protein